MLLGEVIRQLSEEVGAEAVLIEIGDLALVADIHAVSEDMGETAPEYASGAVRRFSNIASDDDWLQLMTRLETSDNPAAACLSTMVRWSIKRDRAEAAFDVAAQTVSHTCTCGGNGGCHDG